MVVPRFVQQALAGQPLTVYGNGQQSRCFGHVQDAVAAIIGLSECPEAVGKVFNIGSEEEISILDLARRVIEIVDRLNPNGHARLDGNRILFIPYDEAYNSGFEDLRRRVPDISKIRRHIDWNPTRRLEEILSDVVFHHIPSNPTIFRTEPLAESAL
jgi:UDP-glucose 4-epimerase